MAHRGEDLYEQHAQGVYRYLFSLGADADTAEDLTQETFCQALKNLDTFRGDCARRPGSAPSRSGSGSRSWSAGSASPP